MSLGRLRAGEWLALAGALGLFAALFLDWFGLDPDAFRGALPRAVAQAIARDGWTSLGWLLVALLVACMALALWLAVATAAAPEAQSIAAAVLTAALAPLVLVVLVVRVAMQPDLGIGAPNSIVDVRAGAYLGLLAMLALTGGAWWALHDERTDARHSATEPSAPRPVPRA